MTATEDGLLRIFWPLEKRREEEPGVLVGWFNTRTDIFVVSILYGCQQRPVENALRAGTLFRGAGRPVQSLLNRCSSAQLQVVGTINQALDDSTVPSHYIVARRDDRSEHPVIVAHASKDVQVINYARQRPERMQFMSLAPISLKIPGNREETGLEVPPFAEIDEADKQELAKKEHLVEKLRLHTVKRYSETQQELMLPTIITQVNSSCDIDRLLQRNITLVRHRYRRVLSVSERVVESATHAYDHILHILYAAFYEHMWPILKKLFINALMVHRIIAEGVLRLVETPLHPRDGRALRDYSASAQQVDLRLQQFCFWPVQYATHRDRKRQRGSVDPDHAEYYRFCNSLWLVANDIIIGCYLFSYLQENADWVASILDRILGEWSLDGLRQIIEWLMFNPAGLKLNNELAAFLGALFIWVIDYWGSWLAMVQPHFPILVRLFGFAAIAGASLPLSLLSDLLSICTIHITCFYMASARIFGWQLSIILSLFHLFRGKKQNVLRNRIDNCDYELDQLLLGTILFTLLFFLLPTVAVFYITFAVSRIGIIILKGALDLLLACLNHFPLFALMLRAKDPGRLPGGINFSLISISQPTPSIPAFTPSSTSTYTHNKSNTAPGAFPISAANSRSTSAINLTDTDLLSDSPSSSEHTTIAPVKPPITAYIALQSTPLSIRSMFHEYFQLGGQIRRHYFSGSVVKCLATGTQIPPLHRRNLYSLQYSSLPKQRVGVGELWELVGVGGGMKHE